MKYLKLLFVPLLILATLMAFSFSAGTKFTHKYRVVIDPGHGGFDPGCIGHSGTEEKGINLSISKMIYTLSTAEPGIEVLLTRKSDRYVDPYDRIGYAHQLAADLFVSVHANAHSLTYVKGAETFVAEELNGYQIEKSKKLAEIIQKNLVYRTQTKDRGIRQAPLFIRKARMPAVLVEVGFLTNPWEETKLKKTSYQRKIAEGIIAGIKEFLRVY